MTESTQNNLSDIIPEYLTHYYEATIGPFVNLSDLPLDIAESYLEQIRNSGDTFASQRSADYLTIRLKLEYRVRSLFIAKGGKPIRERPHYMLLGDCKWGLSWFKDSRVVRIPLEKFSTDIVSFTYGDTFPAMRYKDGKPYRGQVFRLEEIADIVLQFGLPQIWNPEGSFGPDRYIEAQIWDDEPLKEYTSSKGKKHGTKN